MVVPAGVLSGNALSATDEGNPQTERIAHGSTLSKLFRTVEQAISFFDEAQLDTRESHKRGYESLSLPIFLRIGGPRPYVGRS